jgi:hypothetical protein
MPTQCTYFSFQPPSACNLIFTFQFPLIFPLIFFYISHFPLFLLLFFLIFSPVGIVRYFPRFTFVFFGCQYSFLAVVNNDLYDDYCRLNSATSVPRCALASARPTSVSFMQTRTRPRQEGQLSEAVLASGKWKNWTHRIWNGITEERRLKRALDK